MKTQRKTWFSRLGPVVGIAMIGVVTVSTAADAGIVYTVDRFDDVSSADSCLPEVPDDCSLRGAIRLSNQDGVFSLVFLPGGTYNLTLEGANENAATTGDLDIRFDGLSITGDAGATVEIRQLTDDRIFDVDPSAGAVSMNNLVLRGGEAVSSGSQENGGLFYFWRGDSLQLENVHFRDGVAPDNGGCLYWAPTVSNPGGGALELTDVSFEGCYAEGEGGGLWVQSDDDTITLDRVRFDGNTAAELGGGAAFQVASTSSDTVVIQRSTFVNNVASASFTTSAFGGGAYLSDGSFSIHDSTFADNRAGEMANNDAKGGGIFAQNSLVLLRNSTLSENLAVATVAVGTDFATQNTTTAFEFVSLAAGEVDTFSIDSGVGSTIEFENSILDFSRIDADIFMFTVACGGGGYTSSGINVASEPEATSNSTVNCGLSGTTDIVQVGELLGPLGPYGGPTPTRPPPASGITGQIGSASCADFDQRGAPRNGLFCHAGAFEAGVEAPGSGIFSDGFENGTSSAWSSTTP